MRAVHVLQRHRRNRWLRLSGLLERSRHGILHGHARREQLLVLRDELRLQLHVLPGVHVEHGWRLHGHPVLRLLQLDLPVLDVLRQPERVRVLRGLHVQHDGGHPVQQLDLVHDVLEPLHVGVLSGDAGVHLAGRNFDLHGNAELLFADHVDRVQHGLSRLHLELAVLHGDGHSLRREHDLHGLLRGVRLQLEHQRLHRDGDSLLLERHNDRLRGRHGLLVDHGRMPGHDQDLRDAQRDPVHVAARLLLAVT